MLYAGDTGWWRYNGGAVEESGIQAERWTCSKPARTLWGARYRDRRIKPGYNSGANGCEVVAHLGYKPVLMLGFDCSVKHGIHHHGPHKKTANPTEPRCYQWQKQFKSLAALYPNRFINCSRYTEIKESTIPRMAFEDALAKYIY